MDADTAGVIVVWMSLMLVVAGSFLVCCALRMVRAQRVMHVRNECTQRRRPLTEGLNFSPPWESPIVLRLPQGSVIANYSEIHPRTVMRYDPPPYEVQSKDQVGVSVDLFVEYTISDMDAVLDTPDADYRMILDDAARMKTMQLTSEFAAADLSALALGERFSAVRWTPAFGLLITRVGVQAIAFDEQMRDLLRAKAAGATAEEALEHVANSGLNTALRNNWNTSVFLGGRTMPTGPTIPAGRRRPRRRGGRDDEDT
jgi:regulator of protease activity HflC (stomatin/prohibitin superfamily)